MYYHHCHPMFYVHEFRHQKAVVNILSSAKAVVKLEKSKQVSESYRLLLPINFCY